MSRSSLDERPLLSPNPENDTEKFEADLRIPNTSRSARSSLKAFFVLSLSLNILLLVTVAVLVYRLRHSITWVGPPALYTPVDDLIAEHENIVFTPLTGRTPYHGPPTPEGDAAWEELWKTGVSSISKSQAQLLVNRTAPWPGDEENYIVSLDVFHVIHCLDTVRRTVWQDYYPNGISTIPRFANMTDVHTGETVLFDHTDHCLNIIRESLMCNPDVTPNVWKWSNYMNKSMVRFDTIHTCRKWDPLLQWANDHFTDRNFTKGLHVEDGLTFPDDIYPDKR